MQYLQPLFAYLQIYLVSSKYNRMERDNDDESECAARWPVEVRMMELEMEIEMELELVTIGREFHQGFRLPLFYIESKSILENTYSQHRWSLVLVEKGAGVMCYEGTHTPITSPAIVCIPEHEEVFIQGSADLVLKSVYFHPLVINSRFDFDIVRQPPVDFTVTEEQDLYLLEPFIQRKSKHLSLFSLDPASAQQISSLFELMHQTLTAQNSYHWPCRSRSRLLEALIVVSKVVEQEESLTGEIDRGESDTVGQIMNYIHTHYSDKITLASLSQMFHLNRTTLNHQFSEQTNLSIIDYLISYRIQIAATLLRDTLLPVAEIMERVGFRNTTHFWRMFKKHTSLSPSSYRKQNYH